MRRNLYLISGFLVISLLSCRESYRPDIVSSDKSYLVVEGVLNAGGPTVVYLSKTSKLYTSGSAVVINAQVTVEGKNNTARPLSQTGSGIYSSPDLNLVLNTEYRVRIRTTDGKEYLSDYVTARQTPAIDSISWKRESDGLRLSVNAHDPSANTHYYRWDYDETWEIRSFYYSRYIYVNGIVRQRTPAEEVYYCWKYNTSKNILIGSSARLQSDIISQAPVRFIENGNEKLAIRYSILVRQYALDKQGYDFYDLMKRNTESIGTVFDPQPSEIKGNIRCLTDPSEPVVGYISASSISEKRIFIAGSDVPGWQFYQYCPYVDIINNPDSLRLAYTGGLMPIDANFSAVTGAIVSYMSSYGTCVDCRSRGGALAKPSYW